MDKNLEIIKKTVEKILPGSKVMLFGSRSRNTQNEESDYDIMIIIKGKVRANEKMPYKLAIREELRKHRIYTDVLMESESELEKKRRLPGHIVRSAMEEALFL